MGSFNATLDACLLSLFDYSSNFKVSIELVQRLAQQLKLETFVDKLGYSIDSSAQSPKGKTQRLTIAGSSILIDIDFVEDNEIVNVSLSLASHASSSPSNDYADTVPHIKTQEVNGVTRVVIDSTKNPMSFFQQGAGTSSSTAEDILLKNLGAKKLNNFPVNLKYLANMDRLSSSSVDVFSFLERISLFYHTVFTVQAADNDKDWLFAKGFVSSTGKVRINDTENLQLGLFIDYWQDNRFINHEYQNQGNHTKNSNPFGRDHSILVRIDSAPREHIIEYFEQNRNKIWKFITPNGDQKSYKFEFDSSANQELYSGTNLCINLLLTHSVYLPKYLLEFFGLHEYVISKDTSLVDTMFETLNKGEEVVNRINISGNTDFPFKVVHNFSSNELISVESVVINHLADLSLLIPSFRNFLVLSNIYKSLAELSSKLDNIAGSGLKSRRNSKVGTNISSSSEKELTEEAKKKLKESLKLPDDVTDEELLGLNAISENATFSTIQPINRDRETDLDSFFKNEEIKPTDSEDNSDKEEYFQLTLEDIDSTSPYYDLILSFQAQSKLGDFWVQFKISNGVVKAISDSDAMDVDSDEKVTKFIKALNITEDIVRSINYALL